MGEVDPVLFLDKCKLTTAHPPKYLGVNIDSTLKYNAHNDKMVVKARERASLTCMASPHRHRLTVCLTVCL